MKKIVFSLLLLFFVLSSFNTHAQQSASVDKILKQTTEVLKEVEMKSGLPQPQKVSITFETTVSKETGVGIKIFAFKFGRKWLREQTNEITYEFKLTPVTPLKDETLKEELAKAIKESCDQLSKVDTTKATVTGFTVKVSFVIEKSTVVEGEYELVPVTPSLGRSWKKKAVHTIEIEFGGDDK